MPRPVPTTVCHFTHVRNLPSIIGDGLFADTGSRAARTVVEVGEPGIKESRRQRAVPAGPGGVVGDYVPFYFAPRSPMMSAIHHGRVAAYQQGCDDLVYLVTDVETLGFHDLTLVYTDRNAAAAVADFADDLGRLDGLVDWALMRERYWYDTPAEPDRRERRMAECLAHRLVPWTAFLQVAARTEGCASEARRVLATLGESTPVIVRPGWYF